MGRRSSGRREIERWRVDDREGSEKYDDVTARDEKIERRKMRR